MSSISDDELLAAIRKRMQADFAFRSSLETAVRRKLSDRIRDLLKQVARTLRRIFEGAVIEKLAKIVAGWF